MYLLYMYAKLHLTEISGKTWRRDFIPDKSKESDKIIAVQGMKNSHRKLHFRRLLDFISECHNFPEEKKQEWSDFFTASSNKQEGHKREAWLF